MPAFSIFSVALLPQYNVVEIGLENIEDIANAREHLAAISLYETGAVDFVVGQMPAPQATQVHGGGGVTSNIGIGKISAKTAKFYVIIWVA